MKKLGIVRHLDKIGIICLPKELRKTLNMKQGDFVEIFVGEDAICIKSVVTEKDASNVPAAAVMWIG